MKANKLSINVKKTNYVIFKSKQRQIGTNISLSLDGFVINQQKFVNFVGVLIDENVSWKCHINHICKKMSKSMGIISRASFYLFMRTKLSLYYSLVYPYLTYCNIAWLSTYVNKRVVRIISNATNRAHITPLFSKLKILDIFNLNSFYVAKFMFSYHHRLLPLSFLNLFVTNNLVHSYNTRRDTDCRPHFCRTNAKFFSILFQGPKIWNSLPNDIKHSILFNR